MDLTNCLEADVEKYRVSMAWNIFPSIIIATPPYPFQIICKHLGPYSQRNFKPRLTKHDFNDFSIGDKIDM